MGFISTDLYVLMRTVPWGHLLKEATAACLLLDRVLQRALRMQSDINYIPAHWKCLSIIPCFSFLFFSEGFNSPVCIVVFQSYSTYQHRFSLPKRETKICTFYSQILIISKHSCYTDTANMNNMKICYCKCSKEHNRQRSKAANG